ncbi:hypothetical protein [Streptoalloteichus tenebrarius]|nr:hypothetical protein [Streptoalloteichus tenebrarius]
MAAARRGGAGGRRPARRLGGEGEGFAIPADQARQVADRILGAAR